MAWPSPASLHDARIRCTGLDIRAVCPDPDTGFSGLPGQPANSLAHRVEWWVYKLVDEASARSGRVANLINLDDDAFAALRHLLTVPGAGPVLTLGDAQALGLSVRTQSRPDAAATEFCSRACEPWRDQVHERHPLEK